MASTGRRRAPLRRRLACRSLAEFAMTSTVALLGVLLSPEDLQAQGPVTGRPDAGFSSAARQIATQLVAIHPAAIQPSASAPPEVERSGKGIAALDRRLDRLLASEDYLLITRDTLIAATDTVPRSVLVLQATLTVEGTIRGDLVEVGANVFLRPTARVEHDVVNIGGGLYPSALAYVGGTTVNEPLAPYRVIRKGAGWLIEGTARTRYIELDGFKGFHIPTYDRVDAVGVRWGAAYVTSPDTMDQTRIHGWTGYMSGRGALEGGAGVLRRWGPTRLEFGGANETTTNDRWLRGDLTNSLSFLLEADDYRNYYLTRRLFLTLGHDLGRSERRLSLALRGQIESDRSLETVPAWTIFGGDDARPNPAIDEGTITGLTAAVEGRWVGHRLAFSGESTLETAGELLGGDFAFNRFTLHGHFGMDALANHALLFHWYFQGPVLGATSLPRQRWSTLGGTGTLPAYDIGEFRGDRVAFLESRYIIPLPERWSLPILGRPALELAHAIGNAWTQGVDPDLIQNLEARIQFSFIYFRLVTDPVHPSDTFKPDFGLSWPFNDQYPWRKSR